nr:MULTISPECIES: YggT family protein [unclassified Enterococcus]
MLRASQIYSALLVAYALLSWFPGGYRSSIGRFISKIVEPYLSLFDRWNLNIGSVSFTVFVATIILNMATSGLIKVLSWIFF